MKSDPTRDRPSRRTRLSWALAAPLACGVLALAWAPAATARPGHLPRVTASSTQATSVPQSTQPPPEQAVSAPAQPAPSGNPTVAASTPQGAPEVPTPHQEAPPPQKPEGGGPQKPEGGAAGAPANGHGEGSGPASPEAAGGAPAARTQPENANNEAAKEGKTKEAEANEEKLSKASKRVEEKLAHAKEKTAAAEAKAENEKEEAKTTSQAALKAAATPALLEAPRTRQAAGTPPSASEPSGGGSSASAPATPAPTTTVTPSVPAPVPPTISAALPTVRGSISQGTSATLGFGANHATGAAGGGGGGAGGAGGGGAGGGAAGSSGEVGGAGIPTPPLAAAGTTLPSATTNPAAHKQPPATVHGSHQGESQLVKTVTKIVDVVPSAIRFLIAALVALGLALAVGSRLIALRARRLARQRRQLLEDVGLLQGALLPTLPARLGPVATSAAYRPAAGPAAGGDFYDVFALADGQIGIIVGDLSGHGRQALPHTALVRFTLRAYLEAGMTPRNSLRRAAGVLERQLTGSFATVVAATYHPRDRLLTYACAGHPPPVVVGAKPVAPITAASAPPIGAGLQTGTRQTVVSLPGWALACFYTDGVIEAKVGPEELFGPARLEQTLTELAPETTAAVLLDHVAADSSQHTDDMAATLLRIEGGPAQPSVELEELELDSREAAGDRAERFLLACGVSAGEIPAIMRSARATVAKTGSVVLKVRLGEGPPQVSLRHDNVAFLDAGARERASAT